MRIVLPFLSVRSNQLVSAICAEKWIVRAGDVRILQAQISQSHMTASNCAPRLAQMKLPSSPRSRLSRLSASKSGP